jgi:hypothetical protein
MTAAAASRVFKTRWFSKAAKTAGITDKELCEAAAELTNGQGDDLGGNVWKKRLDKNRQRGIVVNKVGERWVFVFLFSKADRENIEQDELRAFKKLAKDYGKKKPEEIARQVKDGELLEICHGRR